MDVHETRHFEGLNAMGKRPAVEGSRKALVKKELRVIKRLRAGRRAPVDSIGCERLADPKACRGDFEWQCLTAALLSSQTRDQATAEAMAELRKQGLSSCKAVRRATRAKVAKAIRKVGFFNVKVGHFSCSIVYII